MVGLASNKLRDREVYKLKIKKVHLNQFRIFKNIDIELSSNLTCISGYNGVGKSTILAVLSNLGELKKTEGQHLNGTSFRGEFADLIKGDETKDVKGRICEITFDDVPNVTNTKPSLIYLNDMSFRATFQKNKIKKIIKTKVNIEHNGEERVAYIEDVVEEEAPKRYRLIPEKTPERQSEAKIAWPTYYLGLSRLYPIGEVAEIKTSKIKNAAIEEEILRAHSLILSSDDEYTGSSSLILRDSKLNPSFGVKTEDYSEIMNSSGQSNLGQILMSLFSFKLLKEKMGGSYVGGLLLIDEIDATLHPVAQNKLIDFLYERSLEYDIQIVFTTHSLSLLEHIIRKRELLNGDSKLSVLYMRNKRGELEIKDNPNIQFLKNDLMETYSGARPNSEITLLTEDDRARWFLKKILDLYHSDKHFKINPIVTHISWTLIPTLIKNDYDYFSTYLIIFDPDINQEENYSKLKDRLRGTKYNIEKENSNILILPGEKNIETMLYEHLFELPKDHQFYYDSTVEGKGLTKDALVAHGPFSGHYDNHDEKLRIKKWWIENEWMMDIVFQFWASEEQNNSQCLKFANKFLNAYRTIESRKN